MVKMSAFLFLLESHNVCLNTSLHFCHPSSHSYLKSMLVLRQIKQGGYAQPAGGVGFSLEEWS